MSTPEPIIAVERHQSRADDGERVAADVAAQTGQESPAAARSRGLPATKM